MSISRIVSIPNFLLLCTVSVGLFSSVGYPQVVRVNKNSANVTSPGSLSRYGYLVSGNRLFLVWEKKRGNRTALALGAVDLESFSRVDKEVELDGAEDGNAICPVVAKRNGEIVVSWLMRRKRAEEREGEGRYRLRYAHLNENFEILRKGELPFGDSLSALEMVSSSAGLYVYGVSRPNESRFKQIRIFENKGHEWTVLEVPSSRDRYSHKARLFAEDDGTLHLVWDEQGPFLYSRRMPDGEWEDPVQVDPVGAQPLWIGRIEDYQSLGLIWAEIGEDQGTTISASIFDEASQTWEALSNEIETGRRVDVLWAFFQEKNPKLVFHYWDLEKECRYLAAAFLEAERVLRVNEGSEQCIRAYTGNVESLGEEKLAVVWREDSPEGSSLEGRRLLLRDQSWEEETRTLVSSGRFVKVSFPAFVAWEGEAYLIYFEYKSVRGPLKPSRPIGDLMVRKLERAEVVTQAENWE